MGIKKPPEAAEEIPGQGESKGEQADIHGEVDRKDKKPKTLAEKMQTAKEKVKAQDEQGTKNKSRKREERE